MRSAWCTSGVVADRARDAQPDEARALEGLAARGSSAPARGAGRWRAARPPRRASPSAAGPAASSPARPRWAPISGSGASGIGELVLVARLVDVERDRHVEDRVAALARDDEARGEGAAVADAVDGVEHRMARVAGPQEVAVERVGDGPASTVRPAATSACAATCPPNRRPQAAALVAPAVDVGVDLLEVEELEEVVELVLRLRRSRRAEHNERLCCGTRRRSEAMKTRAAVARAPRSRCGSRRWSSPGPQAGEVLVEIKATGVCHTDHYTLSGADSEGALPCILGHEGAGVVLEVGAGVTSVAPGDHVIPLYTPECRQCEYCLHPDTNLCVAIRATQGKGVMPDGTLPLLGARRAALPLHGHVDLREPHGAAGDRAGEDPRGRPLREGLLHRLRRHDRHRRGALHREGAAGRARRRVRPRRHRAQRGAGRAPRGRRPDRGRRPEPGAASSPSASA